MSEEEIFFPGNLGVSTHPYSRGLSVEFQETFQRILPRYFESESKIGISLTGGLDSRMIMACLPKTGEKPVCYTFSGEKRDTLDALLAARIAEICGLEHQILRIGPDFFSDFASHVDRTVYATDGYLGSLGAHEIYLNNQARALSPVRLTGVFGGEILRGVSMFKPLHLAHRLVNADLAETVTSCTRRWSHDGEHPVTFAAFREIPEQRFATPSGQPFSSQLSGPLTSTMKSLLLLIKRQRLFERRLIALYRW